MMIKINIFGLIASIMLLLTLSSFFLYGNDISVQLKEDYTSNTVQFKPGSISLYDKQFEELSIREEMTITPLFTPDFALDYMSNWLARANSTIEIENQYFRMFTTDDWSTDDHPIILELVAAADRGVDVRVIINEDADDSVQVAPYLISNGVDVKYIQNPDNTHNKFVAIDDKIVFVSSINYSENSFKNNREAGVVIENENVANYFLTVFETDWANSIVPTLPSYKYKSVDGLQLSTRDFEDISMIKKPFDLSVQNFTGVQNVTLFAGPDTAHETIFRYLDSAEDSLWVTMYTLSKQAFTDKLIDLKAQGLDVRVLLSHRRVGGYENVDTYDAAQQLHDVGIPVYNSTKDYTFTHAKYWIIDGETTFVYSGNWSPRSVPDPEEDDSWPEGDVNREFGVAINDEQVTDYYEDVFLSDWARGVPWSDEAVSLQFVGLEDGSILYQDSTTTISSTGYENVKLRVDQGSWNLLGSDTAIELYPNYISEEGIHTLEIEGTKDNITYSDSVTINFVKSKEDWYVLISEVNFNPVGSDTEGEYIELVNAFTFDVLLDGWQVTEDGNTFIFPESSIFDSQTTMVLARDSVGFSNVYGIETDYVMSSMSLSNDGDEIELVNVNDNQMDAVAWGTGSITGVENPIGVSDFDDGESLQREPIYQDTNNMVNDFIFREADPKNSFELPSSTNGPSDGETTPSWDFLILVLSLAAVIQYRSFKKKN